MADSILPSEHVAPYDNNDRDFAHFSDHVTVWIDEHIGVDDTYAGLKSKFNDNIQVLQSNNLTENEIDDDTMIHADQNMLKKLSDDMYCLKYYSKIDKALEYIRGNSQKRIFFISSGSIGKHVVPEIAGLPQIQGIYIFCGDISRHTSWAGEYVDYISAILEHQDNLLERLTRDIALYLEKKGDKYKAEESMIPARNCYAWSKKLLTREKMLGGTGLTKLMENIDRKLAEVQSFAEAPSDN